MEPELREVRAEPRLGTGNAEIRNKREPEATADRSAVDGTDDRRAGAKQAHRFHVQMLGCAVS
jgi:hypothetical protein